MSMEMTHEDVLASLREIHAQAERLSTCGAAAVEQRAAEIAAISWALLWSESPFEAAGAPPQGE
jgi:hypothetical protein